MSITVDIIKTENVYNKIVKSFDDYEDYFGDVAQFKDAVVNYIEDPTQNQLRITIIRTDLTFAFSKTQFLILFTNDAISPLISENKYLIVKKSKNIVIDETKYTSGIYYFKNRNNEIKGEFYYIDFTIIYDDIISYYFINNLTKYININHFRFTKYSPSTVILFQDLFFPIKYLLVLRKNTRIKQNIVFKLATLGFITKEESTTNYPPQNIPDDLTITTGSNEVLCKATRHSSYKFYISAVNNDNIFYQFLDLYHVIESFFKRGKKYFRDKNIATSNLKHYFKMDNIAEELNTKFVLSMLETNKNDIYNKFRMFVRQNELRNAINNLPTVQISRISDSFLPELGSFIYKIRCSIAHRDESEHIEDKIKGKNNDNFVSLNQFMFYLVNLLLTK